MTDNDRIDCLYRGDFSNFHPVLVLSDFCLKPNWQLCQCFEACQIFPCAWPWPLGSMKLDNLEFSETIFRNIQPFGFLITTKIRCRNEICKEEGADAVWPTSWEEPLKGKRRVHGAPLFLVFVMWIIMFFNVWASLSQFWFKCQTKTTFKPYYALPVQAEINNKTINNNNNDYKL